MATQVESKNATLRIQRFNPETDQEPHFETYPIQVMEGMTILDALHKVKAEQDGSLTFRRSCRHGICGSCAMNINGVNMLACENPLLEHLDQDAQITIRPLSYLPLIKDLVVDRESFWNAYEKIKPWLIPPEVPPKRESRVQPDEVSALKDAEHCIMCGACYSACPVIRLDKGFIGPHAMLKSFMRVTDAREAQPDAHLQDAWSVWDCTTCYLCVEQCPKELEPGQVAAALRNHLVEQGKVPPTVGAALTSTFRNNNPFEMSHDGRMAWAEDLELINALEQPAEALYFVCCIACYDPRAQKIAQAMVRSMKAAGVPLGSLMQEEACCGSEVRRLGEAGLFEMMVEERTELLQSAQSQQMITASPHCYDVYKHHYPDLPLPVEHYTQYVSRLITAGQLKFTGELPKRVTYHDPCYLGIQNGILDEPRHVLQSIPGLELVEMEHSHQNSYCCGGGGGRMWFEGTGEGHLSHARVREALETGAEVLATACPFCLNMLDDAVKTLGVGDQIVVKDIMELVEEAL